MTLVVHRQWASREWLRYPIAELAGELFSGLLTFAISVLYYLCTGLDPEVYRVFNL